MKRPVGRNITKADLQAAQRLKAAWLAMPNRPTQQQLADAWGDEANQSLISQYLNGRIALNYRAVRFFARELNIAESTIRSDLPEQSGVRSRDETVNPRPSSQPVRMSADMVARALRYLNKRFIGKRVSFDPVEDPHLLAYALNEELDEAAGVTSPTNVIEFEKALEKRIAERAAGHVKKGTG